ncbi:unnamed protein product [Linum trigynum]|uniref:Uncharacterized protein n=1 Tax=Linum trigynum TaxID=586398 RepID=A0AAV2EA14_9ROSI
MLGWRRSMRWFDVSLVTAGRDPPIVTVGRGAQHDGSVAETDLVIDNESCAMVAFLGKDPGLVDDGEGGWR